MAVPSSPVEALMQPQFDQWNYNRHDQMENRIKMEGRPTSTHKLIRYLTTSIPPSPSLTPPHIHPQNPGSAHLANILNIAPKKQLHRIPNVEKHFWRGSLRLGRQGGRVDRNIESEGKDKWADNYFLRISPAQPTTLSSYPSAPHSYFTPKTKQSILRRHGLPNSRGDFGRRHRHNEFNLSMNLIGEGGLESVGDAVEEKGESECVSGKSKNYLKDERLGSGKSISNCSSFCSFLNCSSEEKEERLAERGSHKISEFTRHQLFSYYQSLLALSHHQPTAYFSGFETMLALMGVPTSQSTVRQLLANFMTKPCFDEFVTAFQKIVESALKESVVDYFQIVLDGKLGRVLQFEQLVRVLGERMNGRHARQIVEEIYFNLEREEGAPISVRQIVTLCYQNEQFCSFMRGFCQDTHRKRISRLQPF